MNFFIADTFIDSLQRLTAAEQKAVKTTSFDLQTNPASPGLSLHKLERARDPDFWSVRAGRDLRLIVHQSSDNLLLCYANHHDQAYDWAARRKLVRHPATGAAQLVEVRERTEIVYAPPDATAPVAQTAPGTRITTKPIFADVTADELLRYGVPEEWLGDVLALVDEDALLALADHLPAEAAEALLELATGGRPTLPAVQAENDDPFAHPDAERRFRTMKDADELARALDAPWDKWTVFLHPSQREWVQKSFSGPARVSGSAGTGKTVVALHRAVYLAKQRPDRRVLLATFSEPLANALRGKLLRLTGNQPKLAERIDVHAMDAVGERLYAAAWGHPQIADTADLDAIFDAAMAAHPDLGFDPDFVRSEWSNVVDGWQIGSWEAYRDVPRLGRRKRLPESRREALWSVFDDVHRALQERSLVTRAGIFDRVTALLPQRAHPPYDFVVVDEAQDINVTQLRFLAALGADRPNALFFAGDLGQRIFQQPFSWKSQGVEVRGRSRTLKVNYRTSHQIRTQADRLLDAVTRDVDGNEQNRSGTVSVFNGPVPQIRLFDGAQQEGQAVGRWLREQADAAMPLQEIAVFVRSDTELARARNAIDDAGLDCQILDGRICTQPGKIVLAPMHLAKGLEFRAVAVMACDDEVIPSQARVDAIADESELEEVYNTERHLLYVACTRARDALWVSGVSPASEFLDDLLEMRS